jgi:DNA-binding SARP family transcriptional activator/TolB-like protein
MQKPAGISLQLLGKFRVLSGDGPPTAIRISARKSCALLAYLAMHPDRSVSRQQLATLLWADRPDPQARHSLRQCLTSLRADLAPFAPDLLRLEGDTVELLLPATAVDAGALAALAHSTELPDLVRARDLYRGAFLADFDLGLETFDEWARAERARLETMAAHLYEACAAGFDAVGHGAEAIETAEHLVAFDPLREDWQRLALRLCARYRGREAALAKAEDLVARLRSELDVAPSPATVALIEDIRRCATVNASPITVAETSDLRVVPSVVQAPTSVPAAAEIVHPIAQSRRAWARLPVAVALAIAAVALLGASDLWPVIRGKTALVETAADLRSGGAAEALAATPALGFVSMAVLPFRDEEKGAESAVADRMTRDLIDELARAPEVRVISEQTTRRYRGKTVDVAAVGTELGVRYVVEGRVQLQGDQVRVSVALIDSESRLQVWSDRVEHAWSDRSADGDDIARGLARALMMKTVSAEGWRASRQQGDPGVSGLLAQGWAAMHRHNATSTTSDATASFEEVLRRDPDNVVALIGLAAQNVAAVSNLYVVEQEPYLTHAEGYLNQALTKGPCTGSA